MDLEDFANNTGESVKVALRIRPMNSTELKRGDENCLNIADKTTVQIFQKYFSIHNYFYEMKGD